jgi:hypothetical protein
MVHNEIESFILIRPNHHSADFGEVRSVRSSPQSKMQDD